MMQEIVPFSQNSTVFSRGNYVDIVGAEGSTPSTPTIQTLANQGFPSQSMKCPPGSENLSARFWAKVAASGPADCWPWTATKTGNGYGNFKAPWGQSPAHRIAYWLATGEYPEKLLVRHKCDNPICCNPAHLELGTAADNARDKVERGRHRNGHTGPLEPDTRICTCHPDDNPPVPCARKYALSDCRASVSPAKEGSP